MIRNQGGHIHLLSIQMIEVSYNSKHLFCNYDLITVIADSGRPAYLHFWKKKVNYVVDQAYKTWVRAARHGLNPSPANILHRRPHCHTVPRLHSQV